MIGSFLQLFAWAPPLVQAGVALLVGLFLVVAALKIVALILDIIPFV